VPGGEPAIEEAQTTPRGSPSTVLSVAHSLTTRCADHVELYSPPELLRRALILLRVCRRSTTTGLFSTRAF
jgi:hypothetical protein